MSVLGIVSAFWPLVQAAGALALVLLFVASVVRWPQVGLWAAAAFALVDWEMPTAPAIASSFGLTVYADDIVAVSLLAAATVSLVSGRVSPRVIPFMVVILAAAATVSTAAGALKFGVGASVVDARGTVFLLAASVWALCVPWRELDGQRLLRTVAVGSGVALIALGAYHGARYGVGTAGEFVVTDDGFSRTQRILTGAQAFYLGVCTLVAIASAVSRRSVLSWLLVAAMLATVVVSQQRSAAIALGIGLLVMWFRAATSAKILATLALVAGLIAVAALEVVGRVSVVSDDVAQSATNTGTFDDRLFGWQVLLDRQWDGGPATVLFGEPFGTGYERVNEAGRVISYSPHNFYVTVLLSMGVIGLVALVGLLVAASSWAFRRRPGWVAGIWLMLAVFGWTYSWPWFVLPMAIVSLDLSALDAARGPQRKASSYKRSRKRGSRPAPSRQLQPR